MTTSARSSQSLPALEPPTLVTYRLEPRSGGTRFAYEHTGFSGIGGFFVSRALRRVRTRMLGVGLPALLDVPLVDRLALEMAAHEETERRALEGELEDLEAAWREADEIAAIADALLR